MRLSTNLDLRAYAAAHNVTLSDIAKKLGIAPATFSVQYMRMEQSEETKNGLKQLIDEIVSDRN